MCSALYKSLVYPAGDDGR